MKAFIFDLNGTMIDDMTYHTKAWQNLFNNDLGGNFTWDEVKPQMYGKNHEVLVRMFGPDRLAPTKWTAYRLKRKNATKKNFYPTCSFYRDYRIF